MKNISNKKRFYVYALLDPRKPGKYKYNEFVFTHEPFYIGKGCGTRISQHTSIVNIKQNKNPHLCNKVKKILSMNLRPVNTKIKENISEAKALKLEKLIISLIGRSKHGGVLTNIDEGGKISPIMTDELKLKIGQGVKEYYRNNKHPWAGKKHSENTKNKISKNHTCPWTNKRHSKNTKERMSRSNSSPKEKLCNEYVFVNPNGKNVIVKNGLSIFCKTNNLYLCCVRKLIKGTLKTYKKWRYKRSKIKNSGLSKGYLLINPSGRKYIVKDGLAKFGQKHNLQHANLIKVAKGERKHHKGWKCEYYTTP